MAEKLKRLLGCGKKRRRCEDEESGGDGDSLDRADAAVTEGLVVVATELARAVRTGRTFRGVHPSEGWELQSYVDEAGDVTVTTHTVLGFSVGDAGDARIVSTLDAIAGPPGEGEAAAGAEGPCSNEVWVLRTPRDTRFIVAGHHQGEVTEEDIRAELAAKTRPPPHT